jgi:hypothetical protein
MLETITSALIAVTLAWPGLVTVLIYLATDVR